MHRPRVISPKKATLILGK